MDDSPEGGLIDLQLVTQDVPKEGWADLVPNAVGDLRPERPAVWPFLRVAPVIARAGPASRATPFLGPAVLLDIGLEVAERRHPGQAEAATGARAGCALGVGSVNRRASHSDAPTAIRR